MTRPLSVDLRDRVARYVLAGHSRRQAAKVFGISVTTAIRYMSQYLATGNVLPERQRGDRWGKLKAHRGFIFRRVKEFSDITMPELEGRGFKIHPSNLSRFLLSHDWTYKNAGHQRAEAPGCLAGTGRMDQGASADHAPGNPSPGVY
jgi:transposase